jgi:RNA polymerase-interacting CarD/CdnL/TRCF family regulator
MTTNEVTSYTPGDWISHCYHGIGQIEAVERKRIGDQESAYFRIKMANNTFWIPVDQMDNDQIRPTVSNAHFQEAVEVLREPPKVMDSSLNTRRARIKRVVADNVPKETARLIRDLRARRRESKGLNQTERQALRELTKRFLQEWALCAGLTMSQARRRLNRQLHWRRQVAAQSQHGTDRKDGDKGQTSPLVEALARRDDKWSDWLNDQLVKGN